MTEHNDWEDPEEVHWENHDDYESLANRLMDMIYELSNSKIELRVEVKE
jgi:hypothetical protein